MNTTKLLPLSLLSFATLLAACTTPEKQAPNNAPAPTPTVAAPADTQASVPHTDEAVPPLFVKVRGPVSLVANSDVEVDIEILRTAPDATPMNLMITVPTGAQLIKGLASETIVETTSTSLHRLVTVHVGATIPTDDVVVTVDANTPGSGVHATNAYRFGRPDPKLAQPQPGAGPTLSAKGIKLGKPIKAD